MSETNANTAEQTAPQNTEQQAPAAPVSIAANPEVQKAVAEKLSKLAPTSYILTDTVFKFRQDKKMKAANIAKRPDVTLALPMYTLDGIVDAISAEEDASEEAIKVAERNKQWLISIVNDAIVGMAREQVNDDEKPVSYQNDLDVTKLTIDYIASIPKSERTGGGISKETWEAFGQDYTQVMVGQGISAEAVGRAVDFLVKRLAPVKTNKPVLKKLSNYLDTWFAASSNQDDFAEVYDFLKTKAKNAIEADDMALAELI